MKKVPGLFSRVGRQIVIKMGEIKIKKINLRTGGSKLLFLLSVIFMIGFILFASELLEDELTPFDHSVYGAISRYISPETTQVMNLISYLGSAPVLIAVMAVFLPAAWKKRNFRFYEGMMAVNLAAAWLMNLLFKTVFHRARPSVERLAAAAGFSFPSGHSMVSAAFYGYLIFLCILFLKRPWKEIFSAFLLILVFFIGISRIYLGVHYASDVAAGFLAGFSWAIFFTNLTALFQEHWKPRDARISRKY